MPPIMILIADDHTLVRQGLRQLCEGMGGFAVVAEAENGARAVELARTPFSAPCPMPPITNYCSETAPKVD